MMESSDHKELCQKPDRQGGQLALADARASDTYSCIELRRLIPWHAQALPCTGFEMFSQKNDLANMISIMRELPIDGLNHGVILTANRYGAHEIVRP